MKFTQKIFITGGVDSIKYAKRHLDQKEESKMDIGSMQLKNASLAQLAHWAAEKLEDLPLREIRDLEEGVTDEANNTVERFLALSASLGRTLEQINNG